MTIDDYLRFRLGARGLPSMVKNMFGRAFTASSLSAFWRYWNPGYGYYLLTYCYKPLRQVLPHPMAVIFTFLLCGFLLHDIFYLLPLLLAGERTLPLPFVTCWFCLIATANLAADWLRIDFRRFRSSFRVGLHLGFLAGTFGVTLWVSSIISLLPFDEAGL